MVQNMKGIILNDLYNILRNMKQMLFIPILWAVIFLRDSGDSAGGYIVMCAFMFSMMTATGMSYDEKSNWTKYAMILPISKRSYVFAKYVDSFIFSAAGCGIAAVFAVAASLITRWELAAPLWVYCMTGISIGMIYDSLCIPFLIKYGVENARYIMIAIIGILGSIGYGIYRMAEEGIFHISIQAVEKGVWFLPAAALIAVFVTAVFSIRIFEKREF